MFNAKVIWITGASSGIGEALAVEAAKQGAKLILSARRADELQRVAHQTGLSSNDILVLPMDMNQPDTFSAHVDTVLKQFGQLDYVFLNAGITQRGAVAETKLEVYHQLMNVNFFGAVALTKAVLPVFQRQKSGHFVVTSSVAGKMGTKSRSGYCASKHALHGFFDALRAETHEQGIRVTIVCPGYIKTPISLHALNAAGDKHAKMDDNQDKGMNANDFAQKLLSAVKHEKEEIYIGGIEALGIYLKRFFPGILSVILRRRKPE